MVSMKDIARACGVSVATVDHAFHNRLAVLSDNVQGAETLVRYACAKGHRKIAYLHGEKNAVTRNRLEGFRRACRQLGLEIPEAYVRESAFHNPDRCALDVRSLMSLPDRPTCVLLPDDYSGVGGMKALRQMGIRVPEDVSVMGYDGVCLTRVMGLTTYWQDTRSIGRIAAERLISLIERPETTLVEHVSVPGELREGTTVKQLNQ